MVISIATTLTPPSLFTPHVTLNNTNYIPLGCGGWVFFKQAAQHVCVLRCAQTLVAASETIHIRIAPAPHRCRSSVHAGDNLHASFAQSPCARTNAALAVCFV